MTPKSNSKEGKLVCVDSTTLVVRQIKCINK